MTKTVMPAMRGTVRMHHGTSERFERFSLDFAARPGMSGNGHLGVWLAVEREVATLFGKICMDVDVQVENVYLMPIQELSRMNGELQRLTREMSDKDAYDTERRLYVAYRTELLVQGYDIIYVQEADGRVEMAIALDPARLSIQ